ncbi:MAG: hypothetical protein GF347_05085 [Candidatus Moranbacteria bacterium]|nr:hypothetical protein [Candidatus Moranbacteria bacterium]
MFDKLKEINKLRKQMDSIEVEEEVNGVTVKINGAMKVLEVKIDNRDDKKLEKNIRKAVNRANKAVQKKMYSDMMGGGAAGLGGMF